MGACQDERGTYESNEGGGMMRDDMIRMAREAGWQYADGDDGYNPLWRFAALVAAAEREAIIRLIDEMRHTDRDGVAAAIRARGQV